MKIVFFGSPHFVIPVLEILERNFEVVGVVTTPDEKSGRDKLLTPSPVKSFFKLNALTPEVLDENFSRELKKLAPDLLVVAAYGKLIPEDILSIAKFGALNVHPSLLPKYRGASPIQQAILNGDPKTGVSIIKMDKEMDHGPLVFSKEFEILENDTFETLSLRLFYETAKFLPDVIKDFTAGNIKPEAQNDKEASFCTTIKREDGFFELSESLSLEKLERMEKAYYPWPTAWTKWNGKILKFYPGKVIQVEGKNPISYSDFLNGYPNLDKNLASLLK